MPKFTPLPTIGAGDLNSITEFLGYLKDPEKYKERLDALEARRKEINDLIETVGKVKEIDRLRSEAISNHATAAQMLKEAEELRRATDQRIAQDIADANAKITQKENDADRRLNQRETNLLMGERALDKKELDYDQRNTKLEARERIAENSIEQAATALEKYKAATRALKDAIEETAKAL